MVVITSLWKGIGYGSVIYIAAITGIDQEQYEAAYIDGASRFARAVNDFRDNMVFPQVHSLKSGAGDRTAQPTLPAAIVGIQFAAQCFFQLLHDTCRAGIPGDQSPANRKGSWVKPDKA